MGSIMLCRLKSCYSAAVQLSRININAVSEWCDGDIVDYDNSDFPDIDPILICDGIGGDRIFISLGDYLVLETIGQSRGFSKMTAEEFAVKFDVIRPIGRVERS